MARYVGRHRSMSQLSSQPQDRSAGRRGAARPGHRAWATPLVAVGAVAGVAVGALSWATVVRAGQSSAAQASTDMVAAARTRLDAAVAQTTTRAQQRVSRDVERAAVTATLNERVDVAQAGVTAGAAKAVAASKAKAAARDRARAVTLETKRQGAINDAQANPKAAARALMAEHGWSEQAQYGCLVNLWTGESNWKWSAQNAGSGAYGIPQALPARKMAQFGADYRNNPITQLRWGLWYIKGTYGSPCAAWSSWQSRSPHWY